MIDKISLAIPFYNTSQYFEDCIKYAVEDDFVDEIVVNDDKSTDQHLDNLISIIKKINSPKIKLFVNSQNVGPFRNKYLTVKNSTNDWVYLLDSDNHPFEESYQIIKSISGTDSMIVYSPQHLYCKNDGVEKYEVISDYDFPHDLIGVEESKDLIFKRTKWFDWFFNSGNYILNRDIYLDALKEPYENKDTALLDADTAASFYFLLKYGVQFKVIKNLAHHHRLRKDSTWIVCGERSQMSVDYYQNLSLNL